MKAPEKVVQVLFRNIVPIESTTYASHGLYTYPAKFIPHVVRFAIEQYTEEGDWVFDPFAGHGTVGIETSLTGRNAILWDLNPLCRVFTLASTYQGELSEEDFEINWDFKREFHPAWERIAYWHPQEFYKTLTRAWGYWHYEIARNFEPAKAWIVAIPLLKVTRYFSFSDEKVPKLYKSKLSVQKVDRLLETDWKRRLEEMYWQNVSTVLKKLSEYKSLFEDSEQKAKIEIFASEKAQGELVVFDSLNAALHREVKLMITSPPYLQSQEYTRSFKLELVWLGYSGEDLRKLARHEIPYNSPEPTKVNSQTYHTMRKEIASLDNTKLLKLYDAYFWSLTKFLNNNAEKIETIAIFVGPAKIRHFRIPIDEILREHLESLGFCHEATFIDKIVSRRLFSTAVNPATGLRDERTPTEHLLVMRRL